MTIADHIREETRELITFNHIKSLLQNGASHDLISKSFRISMEKYKTSSKKSKTLPTDIAILIANHTQITP